MTNHIPNYQKPLQDTLRLNTSNMQTCTQGTFAIIVHISLRYALCMIHDSGPDVNGTDSKIIAPYGICTLWHPDEQEAR
jgi:hypothetical protein